MADPVIFTNRALLKLKQIALSEKTALEILRSGIHEKLGNFITAHRKYGTSELGVVYTRLKDGKYKIVGAWRRGNRR